jgi:aldose 1-epimerase
MHLATPFGHLPDGTPVQQYELRNGNGAVLGFLNYGGTANYLFPYRTSKSIVIGFEKLESYLVHTNYLGAIIGRFANRIHKGRFSMNGHTYQLAQNNNGNHLHGGVVGFDKWVWDVRMLSDSKAELSRVSPDGEEGYPGNLSVKVTYELTEENEWIICYEATSDKDTTVNLTQHAYFNLDGGGLIHDHQIRILADRYIPTDNGIPLPDAPHVVENTPFDLRRWKKIGEGLASDHPQVVQAIGYDHCFVRKEGGNNNGPQLIADVRGVNGLTLQVLTTEPGVQLFTGNYPIDGVEEHYPKYSAFCLETQHFPDSPNRPDFPSAVLKADEVFRSETVYRWSK